MVIIVLLKNHLKWDFLKTQHEIGTSTEKEEQRGKTDSYSKDRIFTFRGERAWHPPDNATPLNFLFPKSLDQELSADVSFVSVLAMVLSEYWKRLEENFWNKIISAISQNDEN